MDWEAFYNHFREPNFVPGYEIQNRLGGGAFGEVYKARKHSIGKPYAIKFLKIDDDAQREAVERELDQVRHFAAIDHPNLVTIEDLGTVMGVPYLIMGYAGEDTLARALRNQTLSAESALLYFVQACRGVLALHDRRLVHFDLKPSNIFLKGEVARVGDYGLSKMLTDGRLTLSFGRGTPQYMAPEMLKNRADHRADVYSLGVILFESVCGKPPFASAMPGTLAVREDDRPPVFPPDFPAPLRRVIERCLRLDPADRYSSVSELLEELGQTARPGDSIRLESRRPTPANEPVVRMIGLAEGARTEETQSEVRQTAAELTRGAVQIALGMWEGLRTASTSTRADADPAAHDVRARPATPPPLPREALPRPNGRADVASPHPPVVMVGLSERPPMLPALAGEGAALALPVRTDEHGTIPVPPAVKGGWIGTLFSTFVLSTEILVALVRTLARRLFGALTREGNKDRATKASSAFGRGLLWMIGGSLRLVLFVLGLALLGGLVTFVAILLLSESGH